MKRRRRSRVSKSCADHACGCVYCSCAQMLWWAVGFRCPEQYACFGSDVMRHGVRLPPGDLAPGIVIDEALFDDLVVPANGDSARSGLSLMLMLGRFVDVGVTVPDSKA